MESRKIFPSWYGRVEWKRLNSKFIVERLATRTTTFTKPSSGSRGDHDLNPEMRSPEYKLTSAAVLVPIVDRPKGLTLLLTRRTDHLRDHAGQVSFPGGRMEPEDVIPETTALRETEEEIGLSSERVRLVGRLDRYITRTGYEVVPIVGIVDPPFTVRADPFEVAEIFEVPLAFMVDPKNHRRHSRLYKGEQRVFYAMPYNGHYIWGATAGMIVNLSEALGPL